MNAVALKKEAPAAKGRKSCSVLRLSKDASEALQKLTERVNKKDFGKRVRADQLVRLGLSLIRAEHLQELQQLSMSNGDRLEALFRTYAEKKKSMTKDEFLGLLLQGKLQIDERSATLSVG